MITTFYKESGALARRLKEIKDAVDPRSSKMDRLRYGINKIAKEDNTEKVLGHGLAGVDRFGRPLAPLGKWAHGAAFRRRGNGPVLAPHGLESRIITHFKYAWNWVNGQYEFVAGWKDLPWMRYHIEGRAKGSKASQPNWSLPRRDVGGISPRGWVQVRALFNRFAKNLLRKGA
jgi:hypothetical protein